MSKRPHIIIFNPDEIAPHDAGEIRIDISDSELGTLLKTE